MKKPILILLTLICIIAGSFSVLACEPNTQDCNTQQDVQSETIMLNGNTYVKQNENCKCHCNSNEKSICKQKNYNNEENNIVVIIVTVIMLFLFALWLLMILFYM